MNILFLCHRIPYPPNKGDKIRSFNEVKYLSKRHDISLAFLVDGKNDLLFVDELRKYCRTIDYKVLNPTWQKVKILPYLFSKKPFSVPYFYSKRLQNAIDRRLSEIKFDVIFAFSSPMAEYIFKSKIIKLTSRQVKKRAGKQTNRQTRLIMDFVDVDSDKWRIYSEYSLFPKSLIYRKEWKCLKAYEKKVGEAFDISVFVSDAEVELFKSFVPGVNAVSIHNGVDFEYFGNVRDVRDVRTIRTSATIEQAKRSNSLSILFTGAMDYLPNEDGVLYFYHKIWPIVKSRLPHSRFYIVGGNPSKKIRSISEKDRDVIVTGQVADVRQHMWSADVFVAPLRIARGIQNKVLEAMASGLPVVATPQAVQGIGCNGKGFLFIESSPVRFAERTIELARTNLNEHAVEKRKAYLRQEFNWEKNMALLENIFSENTFQL